MGLLSWIKPKKLDVAWEYTAQGVIWRLVPSTSGVFVGEERNKDTKVVSFFCIHQETGNIVWEDKYFEERWWMGIETLNNDTLFLHEYATPDMPDHKKIYAVDFSTGHVLWANHDLKFLFAAGEHVYAARDRFDDRIFYRLDARSGEIIGEVDPHSINVLRETDTVLPVRDDVTYPKVFEVLHHHDNTLQRMVDKGIVGARQPHLIEYLDIDGAFVLSYYDHIGNTATDQLYRQHIIIMSRQTQSIIFHDIANAQTVMPVPDSFFSIKNFLYYIKETRVLRAIDLMASGVVAHGKN